MKKNDNPTDVVTKAYLDDRFESFGYEIDKKLESFRSDILNGIDKVLGELENIREDTLLTSHQVNNHENRITDIEKKLQA